jgi:hypothetical protein
MNTTCVPFYLLAHCLVCCAPFYRCAIEPVFSFICPRSEAFVRTHTTRSFQVQAQPTEHQEEHHQQLPQIPSHTLLSALSPCLHPVLALLSSCCPLLTLASPCRPVPTLLSPFALSLILFSPSGHAGGWYLRARAVPAAAGSGAGRSYLAFPWDGGVNVEVRRSFTTHTCPH